ncbi:MAG: hypothetical protein ACOCWF_07445, partial [Halochromatium sp.]
EAGSTLLLITHRPNVLHAVEKVMVISEGTIKAFGARDEVLAQFARPKSVPRQAPPNALRGTTGTPPAPPSATPARTPSA